MNQTMKNFLERNGINSDKIPEGLNKKLTNPDGFNKYLNYFHVSKRNKKQQVCIADVMGSDLFEGTGNIYDLMEKFYDEYGDMYHSRSVDLLKIPSEQIMERLSESFSDDPIKLAEYEGKYFVSVNGNHRVFAMYLNYLLESQNADTPEKLEALKKKYTFPAIVGETELDKSYANFILQFKTSKKYIELVQNETENYYIIADNGKRRRVISDSEIDEFVRNSLVDSFKNRDVFFIRDLAMGIKEHESFRKYICGILPEIGEQDIVATFDMMDKKLYLNLCDFSEAKSVTDILDIAHRDTNSLDRSNTRFSQFIEAVSISDEKINEYCSIMGLEQAERANIDGLSKKYNETVATIEDEMKKTLDRFDGVSYKKAVDSIDTLERLDFSKLAKEYHIRGIWELKERISQMAVKLLSERQIDEINLKLKEEAEKKFGPISMLRGKKRLRDVTVRNLELQKQYIKETMNNPKPMEQAIRDLYSYTRAYESNDAINNFMERIVKLDSVTDFVHLYQICTESNLPVKSDSEKISDRKQAKLLDKENRKMEDIIQEERKQNYSTGLKICNSSNKRSVFLHNISNVFIKMRRSLLPQEKNIDLEYDLESK